MRRKINPDKKTLNRMTTRVLRMNSGRKASISGKSLNSSKGDEAREDVKHLIDDLQGALDNLTNDSDFSDELNHVSEELSEIVEELSGGEDLDSSVGAVPTWKKIKELTRRLNDSLDLINDTESFRGELYSISREIQDFADHTAYEETLSSSKRLDSAKKEPSEEVAKIYADLKKRVKKLLEDKVPKDNTTLKKMQDKIKELEKTYSPKKLQVALNSAIADGDDYSDGDEFFASIEGGEKILRVVKENGKWFEYPYYPEERNDAAASYMGYLTPNDILQWLRQDYGDVQLVSREEVEESLIEDDEDNDDINIIDYYFTGQDKVARVSLVEYPTRDAWEGWIYPAADPYKVAAQDPDKWVRPQQFESDVYSMREMIEELNKAGGNQFTQVSEKDYYAFIQAYRKREE